MAAQGQSASSSRLPIALHFPTAALPISTSTLNERSRGSNATSSSNPRRSPVPPPGGLPTLPEASHANALHLAGSSASAEGTDNVFDAASDPALSGLTPPQRALAAARAQDYDGIVVELGNALWKERWERLCLSPLPEAATPGGIQGPNGNGRLAAGAPQQGHTGVGGSWEIIHGAQGIARSSSRVALNATASAKSNGASFVRPSKADLTAREAEEWRRAPAFRRSEMNVTKLGGYCVRHWRTSDEASARITVKDCLN